MVHFWYETLNDNGDVVVESGSCLVEDLVECLKLITQHFGVTKFHISISW